ncbi:protein kinase [Frankia sp. AgB1.9]|uniref:serine/threonine-protein kinase n=1 Tax=Frankia sp. AgB1.9 TaxID=1836968 RepID=UPI00193156D1|nr:serine/threonine-protein kinase [Frankia sp. AgB1.9]MBL7553788.1 protein kinase [Frankia sp. AgB1.9]
MPVIDRAQVAAALPRYTLGDQLGAGAFSLVLAARQDDLDRPVAVKISAAGSSADDARRCDAEARILGRLDHPHIARVHDYHRTDRLAILIMELLDGGTLASHQLSAVAVCATGIAMADALAHAHDHGVLHRDIKPDNILFTAAGQPKLTDFGLGKLATEPATTSGQVVGTPRYLAPEVIAGQPAGPHADLYALGAVLYEQLARRPLFDQVLSRPELLRHHLEITPRPLDDVPAPLAAVVMTALAKDPALRPANASTFGRALLDATATVYGKDWPARSGLVLHLRQDPHDEDLTTHLFAPTTPRKMRTAALPQAARSATPTDRPPVQTSHPDETAQPRTALPSPQPEPATPTHGHRCIRLRAPRRWRLAVASAALAVLAAAVTTLLAVGPSGRTTTTASTTAAHPAPRVISMTTFDGWAAGPAGDAYLANSLDNVVARLAANGQETIIAGTDAPGFAGDGGPAIDAELHGPTNVGVDGTGNIDILDQGNGRIRRVDTTGRITTIAGGGTIQQSALTGQPVAATRAHLTELDGQFAVDTTGDVYFADNGHVYKVNRPGMLTVVAQIGHTTDDAYPELTTGPLGALAARDGRLYGTDLEHNEIRMLSAGGNVTTVAGTGTQGDTGDGRPATAAALDLSDGLNRYQAGLTVDAAGDLFIAEPSRARVRRVDRTGTITTVAGTGIVGEPIGTGPAHATQLGFPYQVAAAPDGSLFIADLYDILSVGTTGLLRILIHH